MRVLCTLPHASEEIDGVAFSRVDGGMLSADVDESVGNRWLTIPGFVAHSAAMAPVAPDEPAEQAEPPRRGRQRKSDATIEDVPDSV